MMQHGDETSVKCPGCRKHVTPPKVVRTVKHGESMTTTAVCMFCGRELVFEAKWEIAVTCERADKTVVR